MEHNHLPSSFPPHLSSILDTHEFKTVYCADCGHQLRVPVFCKDRFCPHCAMSRARRIQSRLACLMEKTTLCPGENFRHLVLTAKNQPDLHEMCRFLLKSFKKLRNRKIWRHYFTGGSFVIEVTGAEKDWHVHLHIVVQGKYLPQGLLLDSWRSIVGKGGVFIKTIPKSAIIHYLSKYLTNLDVDPEYREAMNEAMTGLRLFQPFGTWHKLIKPAPRIRYPCPTCGCTVYIVDFMTTSHYMQKHGSTSFPGG